MLASKTAAAMLVLPVCVMGCSTHPRSDKVAVKTVTRPPPDAAQCLEPRVQRVDGGTLLATHKWRIKAFGDGPVAAGLRDGLEPLGGEALRTVADAVSSRLLSNVRVGEKYTGGGGGRGVGAWGLLWGDGRPHRIAC